MKRIVVFLVAALFSASLSYAQEVSEPDDFGGWGDIQLTKSFDSGLFTSFRAEYRCNSDWTGLDLWFVRPTLGYKFCNWLSAGICYDYLQRPEALQHRGIAFATGTLKSGQLSASIREMYVRTYSFANSRNSEESGASSAGLSVSNTLRSRLMVQYTDPVTDLKPYLSIEMFTWKSWQNTRHYVGTIVPLSDRFNLDLFYLYLTRSAGLAEHVLGAGLNIVL